MKIDPIPPNPKHLLLPADWREYQLRIVLGCGDTLRLTLNQVPVPTNKTWVVYRQSSEEPIVGSPRRKSDEIRFNGWGFMGWDP